MVIVKELFKCMLFAALVALIISHESPHFFEHVVLWAFIDHHLAEVKARVQSAVVKKVLISFATGV